MSPAVLTKAVVVAAAAAAGTAVTVVSFAVGWVMGRRWPSPPPGPIPGPQETSAKETPRVSQERLNELLRPIYEEYNRLADQSALMMQYRIETVKTMNTAAEELESKYFKLSLVRLIGSSAGVVGALICCMGLTSLLLTAGAGALPAAMGTTASVSACLYEKMLESKCLAKVKKTVKKDRDQCVKVQRMFDEFESYLQTDPSVNSCIQNFRRFVEADVRAKKYTVHEVGEPVNELYENLSSSEETQDARWRPEIIVGAVFSSTGLAILSSAWSYIANNVDFVAAIVTYTLIAAVGLGNIFVLVLYFYEDLHSKVAKKIPKKSSELEQHSDVEGKLLSVPFCQNNNRVVT